MRIRLYNARILTMENKDVIEGEVIVNDSVIEEIITSGRSSEGSFDRSIDCKGNLLMPGLKNAHTHTAMTFSRSLADQYSLDDWLHKAIFPMEAKLTPEHVYWFTKLGYAEYLRGGITACFDMYFYPDAVAKAAKETGFRNVFCGAVNDYGGIDRLEDEFVRFNSYDPLVSYRMGFHAEYTTSEEIMKTISDIAHKYEVPVYAHISETSSEVSGCRERYNMSPAQLFDKLGLYDFGGGGFHCVWFDDEDIKLFGDKGLYAVFNACSNLKLASGIAPVSKFINNGVNIAVGTDGAGSNNSLSMFREMYLDTVLSNIREESAIAVDPYKILKAGTSGGACCMGLDDCDVLSAGKQADIIMLDMKHPNMNPVNNITSNIIYSCDVSNVLMTMIAGKILYEDGRFTTLDIDEIEQECAKLINELR